MLFEQMRTAFPKNTYGFSQEYVRFFPYIPADYTL